MSFFTDVASEMIYPLIPLFLSAVLGANARFVGVVEGAAESVASLLKLVSGWWSDRVSRRKPIVLLGYAIAAVVRPLTGAAASPGHVLTIRLVDRAGKGIRTAPRDALLADSAAQSGRGRAFGFQRAADHAGAVVGPLLAFGILWLLGAGGLSAAQLDASHEAILRTVFWLSAIPGALALITLAAAVREAPMAQSGGDPAAPGPAQLRTSLGSGFWRYLAIVLVFTLGNSTDAFLLLRAQQLGVAVGLLPILWALLHVVKSGASTYGGALSDRVGRRRVIVAGWLIYAGVYLGFAVASAQSHAWLLFATYGLYFALTEGSERAFVADLVPATRRGAGYGWYNLVVGIGALPASLLFGWLWDRFGSPVAFTTGAALALIAGAALAWQPRSATAAG